MSDEKRTSEVIAEELATASAERARIQADYDGQINMLAQRADGHLDKSMSALLPLQIQLDVLNRRTATLTVELNEAQLSEATDAYRAARNEHLDGHTTLDRANSALIVAKQQAAQMVTDAEQALSDAQRAVDDQDRMLRRFVHRVASGSSAADPKAFGDILLTRVQAIDAEPVFAVDTVVHNWQRSRDSVNG